jgi:hypothetical protein
MKFAIQPDIERSPGMTFVLVVRWRIMDMIKAGGICRTE